MREKDRTGQVDLSAFYCRRILRIWPLYFSFLGAIFIVLRLVPFITVNMRYFACFALFVGNFVIFRWPPGASLVLSSLWSVCIEEQFYLSWPLVARSLTRNSIGSAGLLVWGVSIMFRAMLSHKGVPAFAFWYDTLAHLDPIACGILLAAIFSGSLPKTEYRWGLIVAGAFLWVCASGAPPFLSYPMSALGSARFCSLR